MTYALIALAVAIALVILCPRAEGDEQVGFGGVLEINDGDADAWQVVPKVETLGVPSETVGTVESKRLDLPEATIVKLATLKNGGSFNVKIQAIAATVLRLDAIKKARATKQYRVSVVLDTGTLRVVVPGIITSNPIEDLEAEKITVINLTVEVSGARIAEPEIVP